MSNRVDHKMAGAWLDRRNTRQRRSRDERDERPWYQQSIRDDSRDGQSSISMNDSSFEGGDGYMSDRRTRRSKSSSWFNKKSLIIAVAALTLTSIVFWIIKTLSKRPKVKSVRESWATRAPSEMQDPDDLDMIEFPPVPSDVYKDHIRSLLRQSSQLLDKANQDNNPVYKVMHTSQAIAYANALQKIANPETIQHVGNANLNEFLQVLEDAQTRAVQDLLMEAPDLQSNIPYSMTTGWSPR